jgi:hypothetical protein
MNLTLADELDEELKTKTQTKINLFQRNVDKLQK